MNKYIIGIILLFSTYCFSAPAPSSYTGIADNGESITVSGTGFQTKDVTKSTWLGNYIDSGISGQATSGFPSGWFRQNNTLPDLYFDSEDKHSGTNSIKGTRGATDGSYPENLFFNMGSMQTKVYLYFWARYWGACTGTACMQWKIYRLEIGSDALDPTTDTSTWGSFLRSRQKNGESFKMAQCWNSNLADCTPPNTTAGYKSSYNVPHDRWVMFEHEYQTNSAPGAEDGINRLRYYDSVSGLVTDSYPTGWETRHENATSTGIRYINIQNYLGNYVGIGGGEGDWVRTDDQYISWGDEYLARPMFCAGATWLTRGHCELWPATAWSDTSITMQVVQGSFGSTDSGYLYIVDKDGTANANGMEITLSGEGGETPPADTTPPIVTGRTPAPNATGIAKNTNIEFTCSDGYSNCDASTINLTVNDVAWITNGVINETYASGTVGADGATVAVSLDPVSDFSQLQLITCVLTVDDTAASPNSGGGTWSFRIVQDTVLNTSARFKNTGNGARIVR